MLQIRYSANEVDISGTAGELLAARAEFMTFLQSPAESFTLDADGQFDPSPYARVIPKLQLCKSATATKVSLLSNSILRVEGTARNLTSFLSWFDVPVDAKIGHHGHFDSIDSAHVDEQSIPTIISVSGQN